MYRLLFVIILSAQVVRAQTPDSLLLELKTINTSSAGALLSHRALNVFLSEAAGYYMSDPDNLTLYKNSVIANSAQGTLAIYHNMRQSHGIDEPLRSFLSIGVQANVADAFAARSENRPYNNQFGALIKQTWVGRPRVTAATAQMQAMDTVRAAILRSMEKDIRGRPDDFVYDVDLFKELEFDYAHKQAEHLAKSFNYGVFAFHWTSISLYIPLVTENFQTLPTPGADPMSRHAWPLHFNISHTRLWEGSKFGRFFATLAGDVTLNNARDGFMLTKSGNQYIGDYKNFITPSIKGQLIYFPKDSHIGISFHLEQAIGDYHAMNGILGVPIVLINKKAEAAMNFEFQVRFYDMGHSIDAGKGLNGRTAIGVTAGVPFSKISF
ncbi:MAG: hypothetical protein J0H74_24040 [Chitinophagaceae bacterium]|nr:hypothetical protein [Chitinophagaceae bacterium]